MDTPAATQWFKITHIHIVNTGAQSSYSLWVGATGAEAGGTQIGGGDRVVAANSRDDIYFPGGYRLDNTQYLVGKAADASRLVITVTYEAFVV
jgi:hypothetical protein